MNALRASASMRALRKWNSKNPSFRDLQIAEFNRRELLKNNKGFDRKVLYVQIWATVIPYVLQCWEFWLSVSIYIVIRILLILNYTQSSMILTGPEMGAIAGFISFLLVFYNNQIYTRFLAQYEQSVKMQGRILNASIIARDYLDRAVAWQFLRYLNGAHLVAYVGLSDSYEKENFFNPFNDTLHLFNPQEVALLDAIGMDFGDACYREVLGWAIGLVADEVHSGSLDIVAYSMMTQEVLQMRGCIAALYDFQNNPVPVLYVNLVYLLVVIYVPLFAYYVATSFSTSYRWGNLMGLIAVVINCIFTIGMLEICKFMCEPYGTDLCDLSVMYYIEYAFENSRRIMHSHRFKKQELSKELLLESNRPLVGDGFIGGEMTREDFHQALDERFRGCGEASAKSKRNNSWKGKNYSGKSVQVTRSSSEVAPETTISRRAVDLELGDELVPDALRSDPNKDIVEEDCYGFD